MTTDKDYELFKKKVKAKIGLDLDNYKEQQMRRRINQLMQKHNVSNYPDFIKLLDNDSSLLQSFTDYLTINTSQFFRDTSVYQALEKELLPDLISNGGVIKVWSAGCSIGAEPYSLAMLLQEQAPKGNWRITATDFDVNILAKAKAAVYPENTLTNVPKHYRQRYFTAQGHDFALSPQIKSLVQFRQHNLLTDKFESGCDLILCRNVFIYFTAETQAALVSKFIEGLKPNGYFIIGCSEMIMDPARYKLKKIRPAIYQKIE